MPFWPSGANFPRICMIGIGTNF